MVYQRPTTDIIDELVDDITFPVEILSSAISGATQILTCDDIGHAQVGYEIELTEGDFTWLKLEITDIEYNEIE